MKNIFCWKFLENNHKCVPFGLFITNIHLLLLYFFLSLAVFGFILDIWYKWYKVPPMLTWKGVYTHRNSICSLLHVFFYIITCSFSVFVENCIFMLPKGINEYVWFWFFSLLLIFTIGHKGTIFIPEQKFCFRVHFFFSYKNVASIFFLRVKYTLFP